MNEYFLLTFVVFAFFFWSSFSESTGAVVITMTQLFSFLARWTQNTPANTSCVDYYHKMDAHVYLLSSKSVIHYSDFRNTQSAIFNSLGCNGQLKFYFCLNYFFEAYIKSEIF